MATPERINAKSLDDYLAVITRAVFQAGLRWALIDAKWPAFQNAFANFDTKKVSSFTEADIRRLASDETIIRSEKKIRGTVQNAQMLLALDREFGGFKIYLTSFESYDALSLDIGKRFAFLGEMSIYYVLFWVREPVPPFDEWIETIPGNHPRMREMIELAANQDLSAKPASRRNV